MVSSDGPKSPTTRHVLLTMSLHMDANGGSCFPSTETIAKETGLSRRTVCSHIQKAVADGWITKGVRGMGVRGWWRHDYQATIPAKVVKEVHNLKPQGWESDAQGWENDDVKDVNDVPTNSTINSTYNTTRQNPDGFRLANLLFEKIKTRNPNHKKPNLQQWARHIDLAIRIDKRTPDELEAVINWCQADEWWHSRILSTEKLRKQFDQLWDRMGGIEKTHKPKFFKGTPEEIAELYK